MLKMVLLQVVATALLAVTVMAQEVPKNTQPQYNSDFGPDYAVAPGMYGKMSSPVKSKFNLSIGGFVKLDYAYNSENLGTYGGLSPKGAIPKTTSVAGTQEQSILTARQSRFWLKADGPMLLGAKTSSLIEADFYGLGNTSINGNEEANLRLRLAFGAMDWKTTQIIFGQYFDIFGPMLSSTVDFRTGAGFGTPGAPRVPQIRLTQKLNLSPDNSLKLILGVQNPVQNTNETGATSIVITSNGVTIPVTDSWGAMVNTAGQVMFESKALGVAPGYYGMSMRLFAVGVFGQYGNQSLAGNNKKVDSWGYGVYTLVPILKSKDGKNRAQSLTFEAQAYMAANMNYNTATAGQTVGTTGTKTAAKGFGLAGQALYYPTQDLGLTAGYGRRGAYDDDSYVSNANYERSSSNLYANASYDLNAAIRVAVEYQYLESRYGNNTAGTSDKGIANVYRTALYYFF